jgi:hypothetical protein
MKNILLLLPLLFSGCVTFHSHVPPVETCLDVMDALCVYSGRCEENTYNECMQTLIFMGVPETCADLTVIDHRAARKCEQELLNGNSCEWPVSCDQVYTY